MLIPTLICVSEKRVRFEEPPTNTKPQQTAQAVPKQKVSACLQPQWCEVRRDYKGRKTIVANKGPCYGNGPNGDGGGKGGTEDVKKGSNGNGNVNSGAKDEEKEEGKAKEGGNGGGKNRDGADEKKPQEFTAEEDEKLKALKADGKAWKDIAAEMGKPKNVLIQRWKVIDANKAGEDAGRHGEKKKKDDDKPAAAADEGKRPSKADKKAAKKKAETKATEEEKKKKKKNEKPASKAGSDARFTLNEWVTLQEDDLFSFGELQLLSELVAQYDAGRWAMVASRFFDKTGRRVHAEDVREKFMGILG